MTLQDTCVWRRSAVATIAMSGVLVLLLLAGCAGPSDPPLPVVHASDPVRNMVPDRLEYGQLPK